MSKHEEEVIVDVEELYSKSENWIEENKKSLLIGIAALVVVIGGYFYYTKAVLGPQEEEAKIEMYKAEQYFAQDSFNLAMYGDNAGHYGFEQIAKEYSSTAAGELANYYMGVSLLRTGDFQGAISYLEAYSGNDPFVYPNALGNIGDAYVELGKYEEAKSYYVKAAKAGDNDLISPRYLLKAGIVAEELGQYTDAVKFYEEISAKYSKSTEARSIDKYISRAQAHV